ncbi:hypothetical protein AX15_003877 [Amanita polypyramis BW_CC]|nr:hypothetical protein AX15_003877 [Amanita polypyramis BW_CC]
MLSSSQIFRHTAHFLGRSSIMHSLPSYARPAKHIISPSSVVKAHYMSMFHPQNINAEWARMSKEITRSGETPANPFSGRSVRVFNGNVVEAFRRLDSILGRNKVRAQARQSERHEQKGAKRRRLSSERWRKRFAHEVRLKVQLVQKIRRRGA